MGQGQEHKQSCKLCGRQVRNSFTDRWDHVTAFHPDKVVERFLPMFFPSEARRIGENLGQLVKDQLAKLTDKEREILHHGRSGNDS